MTDHDDSARRTGEILSGDAVWADSPDVLDEVHSQIDEDGRGSRRWWIPVAAAVVVVAALGSTRLSQPEPVDFTLAGTELAPTAAADVRVVETPAGLVLRLEIEGLDPALPGTYYQGWVVSTDSEVSVGTFHMRGGDGFVSLWSGVPAGSYPELMITLQDETAGPARSDLVVMTGRA